MQYGKSTGYKGDDELDLCVYCTPPPKTADTIAAGSLVIIIRCSGRKDNAYGRIGATRQHD